MPQTTKNNYLVTPTNGDPSYVVVGTSYEFDHTSGRHTIKDEDDLVATILNVSVVKQAPTT